MAQVNPLTREVLVKLVYYGPGLGGKTTSLQCVHSASPPETRGQIVSLATPVDRTLYFDFLPLRISPVRDHHVRLQLFTVPGQVYFNATRKLVLTGADGVVFVADAQRERQDANLESLENLEANLREQGRALADVPHIFQFNKSDLPNILSVEELDRSLNPMGAPTFATCATKGGGVLEALDVLVRKVLDDLIAKNAFGREPEALPTPSFERAEAALEEQIGRASEQIWRTTVERALAARQGGQRAGASSSAAEAALVDGARGPGTAAAKGNAQGSKAPPSPTAAENATAGGSHLQPEPVGRGADGTTTRGRPRALDPGPNSPTIPVAAPGTVTIAGVRPLSPSAAGIREGIGAAPPGPDAQKSSPPAPTAPAASRSEPSGASSAAVGSSAPRASGRTRAGSTASTRESSVRPAGTRAAAAEGQDGTLGQTADGGEGSRSFKAAPGATVGGPQAMARLSKAPLSERPQALLGTADDAVGAAGPSWAALFGGRAGRIAELERALAGARFREAAPLIERVALEMVADTAVVIELPAALDNPVLFISAVGLSVDRFIVLRLVADRARRGEAVTEREVLSSFAFLIELALRIGALPLG